MSRKPGRKTFLEDHPESRGQGDDLVDARRRVVAPGILHDGQPSQDVGVVGRNGGPRQAPLHGAFREEAERHAGRCTDGLLGTGEKDVDSPFVEPLIDAGCGADAVEDYQLVSAAQKLAVLLHRRGGTGRSVDVGDRHGSVFPAAEALGDQGWRNSLPPHRTEEIAFDSERPGQLGEAVSEVTVRDHQDSLSGCDDIDERDLHGQGSGTGDDERLAGRALTGRTEVA